MFPAATSGCRIALNDSVCLDPQSVEEYCREHSAPTDVLSKTNSFVLPRGYLPGSGHLLMLWKDVRPLVQDGGVLKTGYPTSFNFTLEMTDAYGSVKIEKLGIVRVSAVDGINTGMIDDTAVIVELADIRYVGQYTVINKAYNYRSFRVHDDSYAQKWYSSTTNGGTPYTWTQIIDDIWSLLPSTFGPMFNTGVYPSSPPENLIFRGVSAWNALCSLLKLTGNTIYRDLEGLFYIQSEGLNQSVGLAGADQSNSVWLPKNDVAFGSLFPAVVRVYFPSDSVDFQNDPDNEALAGQDSYLLSPLYSVDVNTVSVLSGVATVPETKVGIHATEIARYNEVGVILNAPTLSLLALDYAAAWLLSRHYSATSLHTVYHGFHPSLLPGSKTEAVAWYSSGLGSKTEVLLSPLRYHSKDVVGTLGLTQVQEILASEFQMPPDLAREHEQTERWAVVRLTVDIPCEGYGTGTFNYGTVSGGNIAWNSTSRTRSVHNPAPVTYKKNSYVCVIYHWQTKRWIIVGPAGTPLYRSHLSIQMCPGEDATLAEHPYNLSCCSSEIETLTAQNPFSLAGLPGDEVLLVEDCLSGELIVIQVQHHEEELVRYPFETEEGCEAELDQYGVPTGDTVPTGECKITYKRRSVALMTCEDNDITYPMYSFKPIDVLTDVYVTGYDIYGTFTPIFVACICTPYEELLIPGTNCTYGSAPP